MERKWIKIMVFGTFDGLHQGHADFFRQARNLAENAFLTVSIARDRNVIRLKGERPVLSERKRASLVKKSNLADKVILGGINDHLAHIVKERPDIIALGYDQKYYIRNLKKDLKQKGIEVKIFRLKPYRERLYKNHLLKS